MMSSLAISMMVRKLHINSRSLGTSNVSDWNLKDDEVVAHRKYSSHNPRFFRHNENSYLRFRGWSQNSSGRKRGGHEFSARAGYVNYEPEDTPRRQARYSELWACGTTKKHYPCPILCNIEPSDFSIATVSQSCRWAENLASGEEAEGRQDTLDAYLRMASSFRGSTLSVRSRSLCPPDRPSSLFFRQFHWRYVPDASCGPPPRYRPSLAFLR